MYELVPVNQFDGIKLNIPLLGEVDVPVRVRVSGRFIPDVTFDPTQPSTRASVLMRIIQPKVYVQIGGQVIEIDYQGNVRRASPEVFNQPTAIDQLKELPPEAQLLLVGMGALMAWKLLRCIL